MASVQPRMLVESFLEGVDENKKDSMRVLLENQARYAESLNEATFSGAIKSVPKLILPLARRVFTNVIADQLVGVQAMKERTGLCMAMKHVYATDSIIDLGDVNIAQAEANRYNAIVSNDPDAPKATVDNTKVTYPAGSEVSFVAGVNQYAQLLATGNTPAGTPNAERMSFTATGQEQFRETTLKFTQTTVTAKTRKLAAQ